MLVREYDYIIAYEHRAREINSICLLKKNLENRGYSVFVYYIEDKNILAGKNKYKCDVFAMPYGYDDFRIFIATRKAITFNKLVNLQWEQLFTKLEENDPNSYKTPKGLFKDYGVHISWGNRNKKRLIANAGISEDRVRVCGHMAMDYLKYPLSRLYKSREELLKSYGIRSDTKVRLFISSYKSAFIEGKALEHQVERFGAWRREQHNVLLKSFMESISWYEQAIKLKSNEAFIYRPHPGEKALWSAEIREKLNKILDENPNFRIIDELSVQQWILASDWICIGGPSTAIVEAFFAGKSCFILYPYDFPKEIEMALYDDANYLRTEEDFLSCLDADQGFPISSEVIKSYYDNLNGFAYERVVDVLIDVHEKSEYVVPVKEVKKAYKRSYDQYWDGHRFIWKLGWLQKIEMFIGKRFKKPGFCRSFYLESTENGKGERAEILSDSEIGEITNKIMRCFDK